MRAVELYPCSGGMAEGFRRAGVCFGLAFDIDPDACDSHAANMGHRPVNMDVRDLLEMLRWGVSLPETDLLVADPPCTPWSRAGKHGGLEDERDMLRETVDIIDHLRPRCWLIGNVPGLDDADNWRRVVQPVLGGFASRAGYCVDYAKFDCADYGVPQHRVRPFWFGHPAGAPCIQWPRPTHCTPAAAAVSLLPGMEPLRPWLTCRDVLEHLPPDELGRSVRLKPGKHPPSRADEPALTVPASSPGNGGNTLVTHPKHPICEPDQPARAVCARDRCGQSSSVISVWDRPSTSVNTGDSVQPPGHHDSMRRGIVLSEKARAILQGFPESWVFSGKTKKSRDGQIGMAMPPAMAHAVATSIVSWLDRPHVMESRGAK